MLEKSDVPNEEPKRDFAKMFDLDRSTMIKNMVDRMEECMRQQQAASDDLKEVVSECREREFGPRDIAAMKRIAKMRLKDQLGDAREQLEALQRIGNAVGIDLFEWASVTKN
ncbi:MAG: DUF2312 domain-containing protein [Patescibacteria group bacterium]|nr:DUF2312 domain-containing protein [Patescibacteria group bacterium]